MYSVRRRRSFLVYLLLAVLLIAAGGIGLDEKRQAFFSCHTSEQGEITRQSFKVSKDVYTFAVSDHTSVSNTIRGIRNQRTQPSARSSLLLCLLLALWIAGIHWLFWQYFCRTAPYMADVRLRVIWFIHDTDGRKRTLISR